MWKHLRQSSDPLEVKGFFDSESFAFLSLLWVHPQSGKCRWWKTNSSCHCSSII